MPEWLKLLFPVLTAFGGLLIGHWLTLNSKRREYLDDWWNQFAVKEGTEPLVHYVANLSARLAKAYNIAVDPRESSWDDNPRNLPPKLDVLTVPYVAMHRVVRLTGCVEILKIILLAEWEMELKKDPDRMEIFHDTVLHLLNFVMTIHTMFSVSTIMGRGQVNLTYRQEAVAHAVQTFNDLVGKGIEPTHEQIARIEALSMFNIFDDKKKRKKEWRKIGYRIPK